MRLPPLIVLLAAALCTGTNLAATGTPLEGSTLYPRLIRLQHATTARDGTIIAKTGNRLFRSTDDGRSFQPLATVPTTDHSADEPLLQPPSPAAAALTHDTERCCSTLYELPRPTGALPAGTLLYAASFFSGAVPAIDIFSSADDGLHWTFLATPLRAGDRKHGLWEPEFTIARDGALVMFVSDETQSCCSQKLVKLRTRDGRHWSAPADLVASRTEADRPGMAVVSRLSDRLFFMTYEICGPTHHCAVFSRTSPDGWDFGDPADPGTRIETASGQYLAHAPANILVPADRAHAAAPDRLIVSGQMLFKHDGTVSPDNGRVLLVRNATEAGSAWRTVPAPVLVPTAYDNYCPNYSSALLSTESGGALLELASDYNNAHHCTSYFGTAPLR